MGDRSTSVEADPCPSNPRDPVVRCPDDNELTEFVAGVMPSAHTDSIEGHIDACADCRRLLAQLARVLEPEPDDSEPRPVEDCPTAPHLRPPSSPAG